MSLYDVWQQTAQQERTQEQHNAYWKTYFEAEKENYRKILANHETVYEGTVAELAKTFDMEPYMFVGFLDGINDSLADGELDLNALTEESRVALKVDFDLLYQHMLRARADWLYDLPEWNGVRTEEQRKELAREYRRSRIYISPKLVGRNDPCPCGSGKKYKKCCGR